VESKRFLRDLICDLVKLMHSLVKIRPILWKMFLHFLVPIFKSYNMFSTIYFHLFDFMSFPKHIKKIVSQR